MIDPNELPNLPSQHYAEIRKQIRSGDILLCSGNTMFSTMIQRVTKSVWSHVAFVIRLDMIDRIMVLESVESIGVRTVPLSSYVYDYNGSGQSYPGRMMLARHREFKQENISRLSKHAVDLFGYPYDTEEIVRIAARIGMSAFGFTSGSEEIKPRREFICSEYAYFCFKSVGIDINYNKQGFVAPIDFARCPQIDPVCFINTSREHTLASVTE